jgi:polysaccharide export outer membrane protein
MQIDLPTACRRMVLRHMSGPANRCLPEASRRMVAPLLAAFLALASIFGACSCGLVSGNSVATRVTKRPDPPPSPYVIGKDDVLNVTVWKQPQLSGKVLVVSDGTISLPLVGAVPAAGLTCPQLAASLTHRLSKFTLTPNVTVSVAEPKSHVFYALGEVRKPGMFPLRSDEVLSQALAEAGGLTDFADGSRIKIFRYANDHTIEITVDYRRVANGKDPAADVGLEPGDTISVP